MKSETDRLPDGDELPAIQDMGSATFSQARRFQTIFERSEAAILFINPYTFVITSANPRAVRLFEAHSENELIGKSLSDISATDLSLNSIEDSINIFKEKKNYIGEWHYRTLKGSHFWGKVNAEIFEGSDSFSVVTISDISDVRKNQRIISEALVKMNALFEESSDGLLTLDPYNFSILDLNKKALEIFNIKDAQPVFGQPFFSIFNFQADNQTESVLIEFLNNYGRWESGVCYYSPDKVHKTWLKCIIRKVQLTESFFWLVRLTDINEKKLAEERWLTGRHKFAAIFQHSMDALFILDPKDLSVKEFNHQALKYFKMSEGRMRGMALNQLLVKPFFSKFKKSVFREIKQNGCWEAELLCKADDDTRFYGAWAMVRGGGKEDGFFLLRIQNVDDRKRLQKALMRHQIELNEKLEQLNQLEQFAHIGTWTYFPNEKRYLFSDELYTLLQLNPAQTPGFRFLKNILTGEDYNSLKREVNEKLLSGSSEYQVIYNIAFPDGSQKTLQNRSIVYRNERDEITKITGLIIDLTELKHFETNLQVANERFKAVFENAPMAILGFSMNDEVLFHNPALARFLGYHEDEIEKLKIFEIIAPEDLKMYGLQVKMLQTSVYNSVQFELRFLHQSGEIVWGQVSVTMLHTGGVKYKVIMISDVTIQKRKAAELARAKKIAEAANRAKSDFLAHLSHDLRNPLNGILGSVKMLENISQGEKESHYLNLIRISSKKLYNSIGNILDFSKIEAGKLELHPHPFDLKRLLDDTVLLYTNQASEKGVDFIFMNKQDWVHDVTGDSNLLNRILDNLLSNAIKFTDKGFVSLKIEQEPDLNDPDVFITYFIVEDTGIGIKPEDENRLFKPFEQIDSSTTKKFQGTGLGLVISRNFAQLMGGDVVHQTKYGSGTIFVCTIPFRKADRKSSSSAHFDKREKDPLPFNPENYKILIAEDDEINAEYLYTLLTGKGYNADITYNGNQTLKRIKSKKYDLLLIDGAMPIMDGYKTIENIRDYEAEICAAERLPIIGVTGYALAGDREKFINAGADDYATKPINEDMLLSLMKKYLSESD